MGSSSDGNYRLPALRQRCRTGQGFEKKEGVRSCQMYTNRKVYVCVALVLLFVLTLQLWVFCFNCFSFFLKSTLLSGIVIFLLCLEISPQEHSVNFSFSSHEPSFYHWLVLSWCVAPHRPHTEEVSLHLSNDSRYYPVIRKILIDAFVLYVCYWLLGKEYCVKCDGKVCFHVPWHGISDCYPGM